MKESMFFPAPTIRGNAHDTENALLAMYNHMCSAKRRYALQQYYTMEVPLVTVADEAEAILRSEISRGWEIQHIGYGPRVVALFAGPESDNPAMLVLISRGSDRDPRNKVRAHFDVKISGEREIVFAVADKLKLRFGGDDMAEVKWWFKDGEGNATYYNVILDVPEAVHSEYYPYIEGGIEKYFDNYLKDNASVLFMMGPPGTGKTSLIRWMLHKYGLEAVVTHDPSLLESDNMFVGFLTGAQEDVLVLEDADTLVDGRDVASNKLMARFLNVSDGLIRFKNKKMIFTTNMNSFNKVDEALLRPGRCFGALRFRALDYSEAVAAVKKAGLPVPMVHQEYTLAELFNQHSKAHDRKNKVGF